MASGDNNVELLQGTLDLIILRALSTMGPLHSYALANRLAQICRGAEIALDYLSRRIVAQPWADRFASPRQRHALGRLRDPGTRCGLSLDAERRGRNRTRAEQVEAGATGSLHLPGAGGVELAGHAPRLTTGVRCDASDL